MEKKASSPRNLTCLLIRGGHTSAQIWPTLLPIPCLKKSSSRYVIGSHRLSKQVISEKVDKEAFDVNIDREQTVSPTRGVYLSWVSC